MDKELTLEQVDVDGAIRETAHDWHPGSRYAPRSRLILSDRPPRVIAAARTLPRVALIGAR